MNTFFAHPDRIDALVKEAANWIGTPWRENSHIQGEGVACHNLPREIYIACGALDDTFPVITASPTRSKHDKVGIMRPFLDSRPEFLALPGIALKDIIPGDLLGLRIYSCVDHLGVALPGSRFLHVLMHSKTCYGQVLTPPWSQRILSVWRPTGPISPISHTHPKAP